MNEISLRKFASTVPERGLIFYNGRSAPADLEPLGGEIICVPASETADRLGSAKVANMVLLGALLGRVGCLEPSTVVSVLETKPSKAALLEVNRKALEEGRQFEDERQGSPVDGSLATA